MPALSAGMEEGTLARWLKAVGDEVIAGEVVAEIETDKATMEFQAVTAGTIAALLVEEGTTVPVNAPLLSLTPAEGVPSPHRTRSRPPSMPVPAAKSPVESTGHIGAAASSSAGRKSVAASPLARRLAEKLGLALEKLHGSGPRGRVVRIDVERASAGPQDRQTEAASASPPAFIAQYEHVSLIARCEVDLLLALCADLNARGPKVQEIGIADFILKAVAIELIERGLSTILSLALKSAKGDKTISLAASTVERSSLSAIARLREAVFSSLSVVPSASFTIVQHAAAGIDYLTTPAGDKNNIIMMVGPVERQPVIRGDDCVPAPVIMLSLNASIALLSVTGWANFLSSLKKSLESPFTLIA